MGIQDGQSEGTFQAAASASANSEGAGVPYAAFISYRHAAEDRRWAKWLHRSLETYSVPARVRRERGLPARVGRVFRDEEELPASADLSREIDRALQASRFLIVVCSPRTPESRWVNKEVERFRELGRHDRILALLIEGDPAESFPKALVEIRKPAVEGVAAGETIEQVEPLAADVRPTRADARGHLVRMARLRLLACILGVSFDDLRQRDQERRARRLTVALAGTACLAFVMAALVFFAVRQSRLAETRRQEADTQRGIAVGQRIEAEKQQRIAEDRKKQAERSATDAARRLSDVYASQGWQRVDAGDPAAALPWFVRALEAAPDNPLDRTNARIRLATTLQAVPWPAYTSWAELKQSNDRKWGDLELAIGGRKRDYVRIQYGAFGITTLPFLQHAGEVRVARFSADGKRVLTAADDKTARVWKTIDGLPITPPLQHDTAVNEAIFSPDGSRIATAALDAARIWDAATGNPVTPPMKDATPSYISSIKFSPDGSRLLVMTGGKIVRVWDAKTGEPLSAPIGDDLYVSAAEFSPTGDRIVVATYNQARVFDAKTGQPLSAPMRANRMTFQGDSFKSALFTPDGRRILTEAMATDLQQLFSVQLWDAATGLPAGAPIRHIGFSSGPAAFSSDGRGIVTTGPGRRLTWDMPVGKDDMMMPPGGYPRNAVASAAFSAGGARVMFRSKDGVVSLRDAASGRTTLLEARGTAVAISPDGERLATAYLDGVSILDGNTRQRLYRPIEFDRPVVAVRFSADGRQFATIAGDPPAATRPWELPKTQPATTRTAGPPVVVQVWDTATGKPQSRPMPHPTKVYDVAFSPDGSRLVTACDDSCARTWTVATGRPACADLKTTTSISSVAFGPDGRSVLTAGQSGAILFDIDSARATTMAVEASGSSMQSAAWSAAFSPDGRRVVVTRFDQTARVFDSTTGKPVAPVLRLDELTSWAGFTSDGRRVVTRSVHGIRVWDADSGRPISPSLWHHRPIDYAAISADGTHVLTLDTEGTVTTRNIGPDTRPAEDLRTLAEFLSGGRLDDTDTVVPLTPQQWQKHWDDLDTKYPEAFRHRQTTSVAKTLPSTAPAN